MNAPMPAPLTEMYCVANGGGDAGGGDEGGDGGAEGGDGGGGGGDGDGGGDGRRHNGGAPSW